MRLGVMFRPEWPPEELLDFARGAEADGFDDLWLVEDCFLAGGPTMAASALAVTSSVRVGIGLLPAAVRNPAIAAMEIAGLARLHPGRFVAAFGHGVEDWMRRIGARPPDRLAVLEQTVSMVRRLVAGETVMGDVRLAHLPAPPPPILVGTTGPRGLAIAGRAADGFLLAEGSGPPAVRWAREAAGGSGEAVVYAWLSLDDDRDAAAEALRPGIESWLRAGLYPRLFERAGIAEGFDLDAVRGMAVAGDAGDCAAMVRALWDAGADTVVLVPRHEDRAAQVARFVSDVRPRLQG